MGEIERRFSQWWIDNVPHFTRRYVTTLQGLLRTTEENRDRARRQLEDVADQLAAKTLELESLKNKIVERAQVTPILKAKSSADVRRIVEQDNEREFEESSNGIR